jgi:MarR family 2-MHQ and catechol resistance regulon transcriptional repressor
VGTHFRGTAAQRRALDTYIKLMRASDSVQAPLERRLEALGVTEGQFGVLEILHHLGPQSPGAIAQKSFRSGGNVTTVLGTLERRGFVIRKRRPEDRRSMEVRLTAAGRQLVRRVLPLHVAAVVQAFAALSRPEQARLSDLLKKLGLAQRVASAKR